MNGFLYASLFLFAGGVAILITFLRKKQRITGVLLGTSIILIGVVFAVDAFYPLPSSLVYAIIAIGYFILIASVYLMFKKSA
jgi:hypothetical protein